MNYILAYYQSIVEGTEIVSKWIKLIFEYLVQGLEKKAFFFDSKKANKAIKFIENFCHHCEGRSDLIKLELWQKAIVSAMFGIVDAEGVRIFREVVIIIGRKNGKSLLASAIANYCAFADGEHGGKIFCVAPKLDQADIIYQDIWQTVSAEPELAGMIKRRKADYYIEATNTSIKKIAFNHRKSDGFNPSLCIADELSSWAGDAGLKQYEVMKSALGARKQPLILSISTAGYAQESIYDELMKRSTRFLMGDSKEKRLLPFLYIIDDPKKWNDINELKKSNPNLGVSVSVDYLLEEIAIAEGSASKLVEFKTKYCNVKSNSSLAWLPSEVIEKACIKPVNLEDYRNHYCVCGIDLSRTTDLTACVAVIEKDGILNVSAQFFLPSEKIAEASARDGLPYDIYIKKGWLKPSGENIIDYRDCENWMRSLVTDYKILPLQTGYDRYCAQYLVQDLKADGFHMDDVFQGTNLTPVIREFEGLLKDGKINIGDNDLLKIHLFNSALKLENESEKCKLVKLGKYNHIDGMASLLDALCVRQKWYSEIGNQLRNERK